MGLVYIFNLIVGTGALTMPAAFASAGWLLSSLCILLLAVLSYVTAGWMVEAMACCNALRHWRAVNLIKQRGQVPDDLLNRTLENAAETDASPSPPNYGAVASAGVRVELSPPPEEGEEAPLIQGEVIERTVGEYYAIQDRLEMGEMAALLFGKVWVKLFYVVLALYLYGDLAIYEAAVAKSLRDITCTHVADNCTAGPLDSDPCLPSLGLSRLDVYRCYVAAFVAVFGPMACFNVSKTKYMQVVTTLTRWAALVTMIGWALLIIARGQGRGDPPVARLDKLPDLFGVCVYSFMCHHSLPSLITPIANKASLHRLLGLDYLLILLFYLLLALSGVFAFAHLEDLYTLNFVPDPCDHAGPLTFKYCLQLFLLLFPVCTLSTNFPIIAITLRNNLTSLFLRPNRRYSVFPRRLLFPLLAVLPPSLVALATSDVEFLVGVTGAYAGSVIQYVVPAALVHTARRRTLQRIGMGVRNPLRAPVRGAWAVWAVLGWAGLCWLFSSLHMAGV